MAEVDEVQTEVVNKNKRFRKDKRWHVEPFKPEDNKAGAFATESSFATLFPKYREKYIREVWSAVTKALEAHSIACMLDLINGSMSVRTTRKTYDPYIILKARDMLKLLARGVPINQAVKILDDATACDIIKIGNIVRNKERFVRRRQRIIGPDGSTLKAIELLTSCYVLVQGSTVSVMGPYKSLKEVRRIILDCMRNIHPIYRIKELMIRRELAKDPKLATESWDRFLPQFRRNHLTTSQKTAKKNERQAEKQAAREEAAQAAGLPVPPSEKEKPKKKVYTPFPPPQQPRKVDLQLESGEYFLKPREKAAKEIAQRKERQAEVAKQREAERAEAYIPPKEYAEPTVEEKIRKRKEREEDNGNHKSKKKKRKNKEEENKPEPALNKRIP
ncbi:hypothetical protein Clacol_001890 [Clathrus columnatus]|uniref:KRR1 small subunit processome component n=1 Tax=Clathrus columnatus TaxID=1419009 RepID=A0AAV5A3V2_9AGAM|nr:hypothetical protein Clacol_001890 [Clathrus columnatus]